VYITTSEKEEFSTGLFVFLAENISLFPVRFIAYGAHRHFQQYSSQ
jgi:heme/copper-type cytochrome/quinol oxidase subunit 3